MTECLHLILTFYICFIREWMNKLEFIYLFIIGGVKCVFVVKMWFILL